MSIDNFTPTVWSGSILRALQKNQVFTQAGVVNRDYEGDISAFGDRVKINAIGDVTISNYTKDSDIAAPETLSDASTTLIIDQAKYFNFAIDDLDKAQNKPSVMDEATARASYGLRDTADSLMAGLYTDIIGTNFIGSDAAAEVPTQTAGDTVYDYLVDLGTLLSESNVPTEGRWAIVPPWVHGMLVKDQRFVGYQGAAGNDVLLNGNVGRAAGFNILVSNNVVNTNGAKYKCIVGHPMAWSYAEQILETEAYRPQLRFGDALKGLHVYGAKVVRPYALACAVFSKS